MNQPRPPIVTVLGHVDHGKTTLLDSLRKTTVASREAGGITQGTSASVIKTGDKTITFIDTPGHEAFSKMRERGTGAADIVVLVVSADDGVMPQTKEAISYITSTKIPSVIAITKIDLPTAKVDVVKGQLEKEGILLEGRGGDTPVVEVSAKKGTGLKELLEIIGLLAEVNEIKADSGADLDAFVVETEKQKGGAMVLVVVKNGKLLVGQTVWAGGESQKIRGLFNDLGKQVKQVSPGYPASILGFSNLPDVGSKLTTVREERKEKKISEAASIGETDVKITIKAASQGSLEALLASVPKGVAVVSSGVGDVTEGDVFFAKAGNLKIFVFEAKVPSNVKKLSETEGVQIESFKIIYELLKKLEEDVVKKEVKVLGKAQIIKVFSRDDGKKIAGSKMLEGLINKKSKLTLIRNDKNIGDIKIISMKKEKKEALEVKRGEEFGIYFEPQFDFKTGDMLLSVLKD